MAQFLVDHFIPIPKHELVSAAVKAESPPDAALLRKLLHWLGLLFHVQFFEMQEQLKHYYDAFDPDTGGKDAISPNPANYRVLRDLIDETLKAANFKPLTQAFMQQVDPRTGRLAQKIVLPKGVFRDLRFYARGARARMITTPGFLGLPIWRKRVMVEGYDHVMLAATTSYGMSEKLQKSARLRPGAVYLKLFRDIAQGDLLTLVPHVRISMHLRDRLFLGVPALVAGVPLLLKVVPAVSVLLVVAGAYLGISARIEEDISAQVIAAAVVLGGLVGFLMRAWTSYDRKALRNQKQVVDNAYFNKLNTNAGCFDYLIGAAEDAELKEAFLAYVFLRRAKSPMDSAALDAEIENWVHDRFGLHIDFEIDDALAKLRRLGIVTGENSALRAVSLSKALECAARAWHAQANTLGMALAHEQDEQPAKFL